MSTNERDTHFANFARLLWQELLMANDIDDMYGYIDVSTDTNMAYSTDYQQIIARRAYDLVKHAFEEVNPIALQATLSSEEIVNGVPDMTSFPEQASPQSP